MISSKFIVERCTVEENADCRTDSKTIETYNFPSFYFEVHHVHQKLEITKTKDNPVLIEDNIVGIVQFSHTKYQYVLNSIRQNTVEMKDTFIPSP